MRENFFQKIAVIHKKRRNALRLTKEEFQLLLADCILDKRMFTSPNWNWRYGGVRWKPFEAKGSDPLKILVLLWPGSLGDVAMSAPVFSTLRQKYPHAEISFLTSRIGQKIFMGNPHIDCVLENPLEPYLDKVWYGESVRPKDLLNDIACLIDSLNKHRYDLLINLQLLPMSAGLTKLTNATCTVGMTLTCDGMPVTQGNVWTAYLFGVSTGLMRAYNLLHRTDIFCRMIDETDKYNPDPVLLIPQEALESAQRFFDQNGICDTDVVIGLNPMAGTPIRQWPFYDQLAKRIRDELKAQVIIFGAKEEEALVEKIVCNAGKKIIQATRFDIHELLAAICGCDLFITNDTGPMHLACLLNRKIIALFGPTSFQEVGPWQNEFYCLQASVCRNCYKQTCVNPERYCMHQIRVQDVMKVAKNVLNDQPIQHRWNHLIYHSSKENNLPFDKNTRLGSLILQVFNTKSKTKGFGANNTFETFDEKEALFEAIHRLKSLVRKAIDSLNQPKGLNHVSLENLHRSIESVKGFLRPIVAINALQFLDRRVSLKQDPFIGREFYEGLEKDLDTLAGILRGI